MKHRYGAVSLALVLSVLVALVAALVVVRVSEAITYEPTLTAQLSSPAAGASADLTTEFGIPKGSAQFFAQATFTPPQFGLTPANVPKGALVAKINALATLGLINGPCSTALTVIFDSLNPDPTAGSGMFASSTNISDTVTFDDQFQDLDGNTLPDGVDKYPDFLTRMFPGVTPVARQYGQVSVAGSAVSLNFVIFQAGATLPAPLGTLDATWGYPSVSVLNNNGDPGAVAAPSAITDFCTPLRSTVTTYGVSKDNPDSTADESGTTIQTNPAAAGTYTFHSLSVSQYDADDDDIENGIDTCPFNKFVDANGDTVPDDTDNDGIDDSCDPTPTQADADPDRDLYSSRNDNCPLVANGQAAGQDNQADRDTDSIGDACDTLGAEGIGKGPDVPDGGTASPVTKTITADVTITGAAVSPTAAATTVVPTTAATKTPTAVAGSPTKTATTAATATKTATATPVKTATPTPVVTTAPPPPGGGGLLEDDEGFPTWAFIVIGVAAVLLLGGLSTAFTVVRRRSR